MYYMLEYVAVEKLIKYYISASGYCLSTWEADMQITTMSGCQWQRDQQMIPWFLMRESMRVVVITITPNFLDARASSLKPHC